jgi:hypothetical protein
MSNAEQKGMRLVAAVTGWWAGVPPGEAWRGRLAGTPIISQR